MSSCHAKRGKLTAWILGPQKVCHQAFWVCHLQYQMDTATSVMTTVALFWPLSLSENFCISKSQYIGSIASRSVLARTGKEASYCCVTCCFQSSYTLPCLFVWYSHAPYLYSEETQGSRYCQCLTCMTTHVPFLSSLSTPYHSQLVAFSGCRSMFGLPWKHLELNFPGEKPSKIASGVSE